MDIPFIDLHTQRKRLEPKLSQAIQRVLVRGDFIYGEEVRQLEKNLATFIGINYAIGCANGTDALTLVAMAENIGAGDAVFIPAFTFAASAEAFILLGAVPYFVDVDPDTFNICPDSLKLGIMDARKQGLTPRMVVAVDLFGQPANYKKLGVICEIENLILVSDAAQALGSTLDGASSLAWAHYMTTSFFPAKPLGCYGDGGAILTDDEDKACLIKSLTQHGKGSDKYDHVRVGMNSRLDTLQAAVLIEKLTIFPDEIIARNKAAAFYNHGLGDRVSTPKLMDGVTSTWAQYTLKVKGREILRAKLKERGIPSAVYYPLSLNQQKGYRSYPVVPSGVGGADALSRQVLSLPMHPYMNEELQSYIIDACISAM